MLSKLSPNQCRVQSAVTPFFQLINDKLHDCLYGTAEPSPSVTSFEPCFGPPVVTGSLRIATAPRAPDPLLATLQTPYYFKAARNIPVVGTSR